MTNKTLSVSHTPGPWAYKAAGCWIDDGGNAESTPTEFLLYPIMGRLLVGNVPVIMREADARLIAAAPDLLAALQTAVTFFDDNGGDESYTWLPAMKAAIAKATRS